jgi:integrase
LSLSNKRLRGRLRLIGLHEARHVDASLMIAADVKIKTISAWMGHSSVNTTLDRYVHLLPDSAQVALGRRSSWIRNWHD